jgi:hypothetical protein
MTDKPLSHAEAVTKSRQNTGAKGVNVSMKPEERALLQRLADTHGGVKGAIMAGLRCLEAGAPDPTPEQALEVLSRVIRK